VPRTLPAIPGLILLAACTVGCATTHVALLPPAPCCGAQAVVFCADGAGNSAGLSTALRQAVAAERLPLCVETVDWSYGPGRYLADEIDYAHARVGGRRLAARVAAYRQAYPGSRVCLIGHSAGSAVVLAAAEDLPPGAVDRIVLLSPAVSSGYDLRPALRTARQGIDVFCSERDWLVLGVGVRIVGTTDRRWGPAAGRVGFNPVITGPDDAALYARLREHPWDPCLAWTGNTGGHFGTYEQPRFLHAYVLPLLTRETPEPVDRSPPQDKGSSLGPGTWASPAGR
jgi:pimeloyl-ACP methyl ester carboxylesterase